MVGVGARFDVERFDCKSTFADRQGGLRRSSRRRVAAHAATRLQAAAVVGSMGAFD